MFSKIAIAASFAALVAAEGVVTQIGDGQIQVPTGAATVSVSSAAPVAPVYSASTPSAAPVPTTSETTAAPVQQPSSYSVSSVVAPVYSAPAVTTSTIAAPIYTAPIAAVSAPSGAPVAPGNATAANPTLTSYAASVPSSPSSASSAAAAQQANGAATLTFSVSALALGAVAAFFSL